MKTANQRIGLRRVLPIVTPADMAQISLANEAGKPLLIGDVANVVEDHQPLTGDAVINDGPGLLLVVEKLPWANALTLNQDVEKVVATLGQGLPGVEFDTKIFQQARFIDTAIHNLRRRCCSASCWCS